MSTTTPPTPLAIDDRIYRALDLYITNSTPEVGVEKLDQDTLRRLAETFSGLAALREMIDDHGDVLDLDLLEPHAGAIAKLNADIRQSIAADVVSRARRAAGDTGHGWNADDLDADLNTYDRQISTMVEEVEGLTAVLNALKKAAL